MKSLMLAAGLGTRLRPLTNFRPKPLCLFYGTPILDIVYHQLIQGGVESIAINTHHLSHLIDEHLTVQSRLYKQRPVVSFEPEILGTGGCVNPLRAWIKYGPLLIYNADIVADVDISALIQHHSANGAFATMVLLPQNMTGTTPVFWKNDQVLQIGGSQPSSTTEVATFAGIHILSPEFIRSIPDHGFQQITDTYQLALAKGLKISCYLHDGFWADLGNPKDYWQAHEDLRSNSQRINICDRLGLNRKSISWCDELRSASVNADIFRNVSESFIFGPVKLPNDVTIQQCIVYPQSELLGQNRINRSIVMAEAKLDF